MTWGMVPFGGRPLRVSHAGIAMTPVVNYSPSVAASGYAPRPTGGRPTGNQRFIFAAPTPQVFIAPTPIGARATGSLPMSGQWGIYRKRPLFGALKF